MDFEDYKAHVPLPNGDTLCFNERNGQMEIVSVTAKPANLRTVSKDALVKLKMKLDALNKQS